MAINKALGVLLLCCLASTAYGSGQRRVRGGRGAALPACTETQTKSAMTEFFPAFTKVGSGRAGRGDLSGLVGLLQSDGLTACTNISEDVPISKSSFLGGGDGEMIAGIYTCRNRNGIVTALGTKSGVTGLIDFIQAPGLSPRPFTFGWNMGLPDFRISRRLVTGVLRSRGLSGASPSSRGCSWGASTRGLASTSFVPISGVSLNCERGPAVEAESANCTAPAIDQNIIFSILGILGVDPLETGLDCESLSAILSTALDGFESFVSGLAGIFLGTDDISAIFELIPRFTCSPDGSIRLDVAVANTQADNITDPFGLFAAFSQILQGLDICTELTELVALIPPELAELVGGLDWVGELCEQITTGNLTLFAVSPDNVLEGLDPEALLMGLTALLGGDLSLFEELDLGSIPETLIGLLSNFAGGENSPLNLITELLNGLGQGELGTFFQDILGSLGEGTFGDFGGLIGSLLGDGLGGLGGAGTTGTGTANGGRGPRAPRGIRSLLRLRNLGGIGR